MSSPVDTTFSSGTTITHEWLNGTNDHVNNKEANPHDQYTLSTDLASSAAGKGAELIGFTAAGDGAAVRNEQDKSRERVTPEDYEAVGDGVADDTVSLIKWLAATAGTHELVAGKTYLVAPVIAGTVILPIISGSKINIKGNGARIKIKDASPGFYSIMGANSSSVDLSGVNVRGVVFDHNSQNNTFTASANVLTNPRFTFSALAGSDIFFCDNLIANAVCTNSVFINNSANVVRPRVTGNGWLNVGGSATSHDHSTIYVVGQDFTVCDNYAQGVSLGATGTACFLEMHGDGMLVENNYCRDFEGFANITGIYDGGDTRNSLVAGNIAIVRQHGVRVFSQSYGSHTSGYGIDGLTISGNRMRIKQTSLPSGSSRYYMAYGVQAGSSLPTRNIQIVNNVVEYDLEVSAPNYTSLSCAIGFNDTSGTIVHENFVAKDNTIINAPGQSIGLGMGGGVFKNAHIGVNTHINPAQSLYASYPSSYKAAVLLAGNQYTGSLTIDKQTVIDDNAVTRLVYGVAAYPTNDSSSTPCTIDLDIKLNGDKAAYSTPMVNSSSRLLPLMTVRQNKAHSSTGQTFKVRSSVMDTAGDLEYRIHVQGGTWTDHGFASSTPVSTNPVGSTRINTAPATGGYEKWVYTATGWKGSGLIA
jgi:hypothetical protein